MALILHYHPLASFCWKTLIALYENNTPFEQVIVDLGEPGSAAAFAALWPIRKMPVLEDTARGVVVPESTLVVEHLDLHHRGAVRFVPDDDDEALQVRLWDRVFDLYVQQPMQKIVHDRLRPEGRRDPHGVAEARATLDTAYAMIERRMAEATWAAGETFSLADCAAGPALHYADMAHPLGAARPATRRYLERLRARSSFARVLAEAQPYAHLLPRAPRPRHDPSFHDIFPPRLSAEWRVVRS